MPGRRHGGATLRGLALALAATAATAPPVSALGVGGATWTPVSVTSSLALSGFRTCRDSVHVFLWLRWDAAGIRALRRYEADGLRYTQEVNDTSGNLSPTGSFVTDLPGAAYDRDDGDGRWEEVELTVTQARALETGRTYMVGFQLSRWSRACEDDACAWRWDSGRGRLAVLSQLSRHFLGEWQAIRSTRPYAALRYRRLHRPDA